MNLLKFKNYIKSFPFWKVFNYSISDPFSWRWSYDEVCFSIENKQSSQEEILEKIYKAYTDTFCWWKWWEYKYWDLTPVNFESEEGSYSDWFYVKNLLEELYIDRRSEEQKLIETIFS